VTASLCLTPAAFGQVALANAKADEILNQLTSRPRQTWISAGTIEGYHYEKLSKVPNEAKITEAIDTALREYEQERLTSAVKQSAEAQESMRKAIPFNVRYKLANNYEMSTWEQIKCDGDYFRWEIKVSSRDDTLTPDTSLSAQYVTDEFNMSWNQFRVFAWDGREYTIYFSTPDGAGYRVVDAAGKLPRPVSGPLTAGLIPWGHGKFSAKELADAKVSIRDAGATIEMTINHADGASSELSLDPSKGYAVTTATLTGANAFSVTYRCSDYQPVGEDWVPSSVTIERSNCGDENRAPTLEVWTDIRVGLSKSSLGGFSAPLALDTTVEYLSPVSASPAMYTHSYEVDVDALLAERLAYAAGERSRAQNCATAALDHVASQFGKLASGGAMTRLVRPNGDTSVADIKRAAEDLGLNCRVVQADVETLRNLGDAKAILHIPSKNHFVVLDRVDSQYVWLIDLSNSRFYYRQSVQSFPADWTTGTALLLSDRPLAGPYAELPAATLDTIVGTGKSCTRLIQEEDYLGCVDVGGFCQGAYQYYWRRYGCESAPYGTCSESLTIRMQEIACISDPIRYCDVVAPWYAYYCMACN
jgi:hypothetical protein